MGEKTGAGGKPQTYDERTGRYGSNASGGKKNGRVVAPLGERRGCIYIGKDGSRQFVPDGEKPKENGVGTFDEKTTIREHSPKKKVQDAGKNLTKKDWARIYEKLGEEKRGRHLDRRTNGDRVIVLHKMSDSDSPKLAFVSGTYEHPKLKGVLEFHSEEKMLFVLERMKR